jgi:hypothetical protein
MYVVNNGGHHSTIDALYVRWFQPSSSHRKWQHRAAGLPRSLLMSEFALHPYTYAWLQFLGIDRVSMHKFVTRFAIRMLMAV